MKTKRKTKVVTKSAFILSFTRKSTAAEIVAAAAKRELFFSTDYVYLVRSLDAKKRATKRKRRVR